MCNPLKKRENGSPNRRGRERRGWLYVWTNRTFLSVKLSPASGWGRWAFYVNAENLQPQTLILKRDSSWIQVWCWLIPLYHLADSGTTGSKSNLTFEGWFHYSARSIAIFRGWMIRSLLSCLIKVKSVIWDIWILLLGIYINVLQKADSDAMESIGAAVSSCCFSICIIDSLMEHVVVNLAA